MLNHARDEAALRQRRLQYRWGRALEAIDDLFRRLALHVHVRVSHAMGAA
jgi:hypothetical protein